LGLGEVALALFQLSLQVSIEQLKGKVKLKGLVN